MLCRLTKPQIRVACIASYPNLRLHSTAYFLCRVKSLYFFVVLLTGCGSHGHPCTDYNVPNHVDSLLKKRHPHAGKNRVRQGCRTRFSAQWTAAGIAKCSNEIGFDNFVKPDLAWKIFRKLFGNLAGKFRPQAALGSGVFPCKRVLTSRRYACVKRPP